MDRAEQALAELMKLSSQVEAAALFDRDGGAESTLGGDRAAQLASTARTLMEEAERLREGSGLTQLEAATAEGSLFVAGDGERLIAAATGPGPTSGLVFYDLKSCLRSARARRKKPDAPT